MGDWMEAVVEGIKFKQFDAQVEKWGGSKGKMLEVRCDIDDVKAISKRTGIAIETKAKHKAVDVNLESILGMKVKEKVYKVRFRETGKKSGSKKPDAKTTAMQEKGS